MIVNLDRLQQENPRLHRVLVRMCRLGDASGSVDINPAPLSEFNLGELQEFLKAESQPPPPPVAERLSLSEMETDRTERLRLSDLERGLARLQQYVSEQGLAEDKANAAAVQEWLNANVKGYWSQQGVDAAIANLGPRGTNILIWKPKVVAPPPQPEEPKEVLGTLRNGEPQLPLDASEQIMKKASVAQLKDLIDRRRKEQPYIRTQGSFGSRF